MIDSLPAFCANGPEHPSVDSQEASCSFAPHGPRLEEIRACEGTNIPWNSEGCTEGTLKKASCSAFRQSLGSVTEQKPPGNSCGPCEFRASARYTRGETTIKIKLQFKNACVNSLVLVHMRHVQSSASVCEVQSSASVCEVQSSASVCEVQSSASVCEAQGQDV
jgi:hypothetical protein